MASYVNFLRPAAGFKLEGARLAVLNVDTPLAKPPIRRDSATVGLAATAL